MSKRINDIFDLAAKKAKEISEIHQTAKTEGTVSRVKQVGKIVHYVNPLNWYTRKVADKILRSFTETNTMLMDGEYGNPYFDLGEIYYYCKTNLGKRKGSRKFGITSKDLNIFYEAFILSYSALMDLEPSFTFATAKKSLLIHHIYLLSTSNPSKLKEKLLYLFINNMAEAYDV